MAALASAAAKPLQQAVAVKQIRVIRASYKHLDSLVDRVVAASLHLNIW
jgi:hypothetical protein